MLGTEQPEKSARTVAREAFFLEFATEVRKRYPNTILMLTGGFRTRAGAEYAIKQNACDLIGIGRPSAINAKFPQLLLDESLPDEKAGLPLESVKPPWFASWIPAKGLFAGLETVSGSPRSSRSIYQILMNGYSHTMLDKSSGWPRNSLRLFRLNVLPIMIYTNSNSI